MQNFRPLRLKKGHTREKRQRTDDGEQAGGPFLSRKDVSFPGAWPGTVRSTAFFRRTGGAFGRYIGVEPRRNKKARLTHGSIATKAISLISIFLAGRFVRMQDRFCRNTGCGEPSVSCRSVSVIVPPVSVVGMTESMSLTGFYSRRFSAK